MSERYATLLLYYASCTASEGLESGKLVLDQTSQVASDRDQEAMKIALGTVDSQTNGERPRHIEYIGKGTVPNEASALQVIDYAEQRIRNSHGITELDKIENGKIFFKRKLRLDGFTQTRKEELVRKLQKPGIFKDGSTLEEALEFF